MQSMGLYESEDLVRRRFPRAFVEKDAHGFCVTESGQTNARVLGRGDSTLVAWGNAAKYVARHSDERAAMLFEQG